MRISDWSSDLCSSELLLERVGVARHRLVDGAAVVELAARTRLEGEVALTEQGGELHRRGGVAGQPCIAIQGEVDMDRGAACADGVHGADVESGDPDLVAGSQTVGVGELGDRKSTRLNS